MARTASTALRVPPVLLALLAIQVLLVSRARSALSGLLGPRARMVLLVPRVRSGLPARTVLLVTLGLPAPSGRRATPALPVLAALPGLPGLLGLLGHRVRPSASSSLTTHTSRAQSSSPWTARPTTPLSAAGSTSRVR
jgi:hypothetical protein